MTITGVLLVPSETPPGEQRLVATIQCSTSVTVGHVFHALKNEAGVAGISMSGRLYLRIGSKLYEIDQKMEGNLPIAAYDSSSTSTYELLFNAMKAPFQAYKIIHKFGRNYDPWI